MLADDVCEYCGLAQKLSNQFTLQYGSVLCWEYEDAAQLSLALFMGHAYAYANNYVHAS